MEKIVAEIQQHIDKLTETWNTGDIDNIPMYFTKSMIYIYSDIIYGVDDFIAFLKENFSDMGRFKFLDVQIKVLSMPYVFVYGRWTWENKDDIKSDGTFSWVCEKTTQGWKIAVDHTTEIQK